MRRLLITTAAVAASLSVGTAVQATTPPDDEIEAVDDDDDNDNTGLWGLLGLLGLAGLAGLKRRPDTHTRVVPTSTTPTRDTTPPITGTATGTSTIDRPGGV